MDNPYYIKGTDVLKNKLGITDAAELEKAEEEATTNRLAELSETPIEGSFDYQHLKNIHKHIFQDIYDWAGKERTIQTSKNGHHFEWPDRIKISVTKLLAELKNEDHLRNLDKPEFVERVAHYYAELNVAHPFPEGNGRAQKEFFSAIAENAGYEFQWIKLEREEILEAAIHSYAVDNTKLERCFTRIAVSINQQKLGTSPPRPTSQSLPDTIAIAQSRKTLTEATELQLQKLKAPFEAQRKQLEAKVTKLKKQVSQYNNINEPLVGKSRHRAAGVMLADRLTEANHDLHVFSKKYKSQIPKLRKQAARIAEKMNPQAAAIIAKQEDAVKQSHKSRTRETPNRSR